MQTLEPHIAALKLPHVERENVGLRESINLLAVQLKERGAELEAKARELATVTAERDDLLKELEAKSAELAAEHEGAKLQGEMIAKLEATRDELAAELEATRPVEG